MDQTDMNVPAVTSCARTDKCTEVRKTVLGSFYKKTSLAYSMKQSIFYGVKL